MSNKKKSKKKQTKNTAALLGDNRKQKTLITIGLIVSCIMFVAIFGFIIPSMNNEEPDDEIKQTVHEDISLKLLGGSLIEEKNCYNIWFDINTILEDGVITFEARDGLLMKFDNETEETSLVTTDITYMDTQKYSFIWVFDKPENNTILTDISIIIENKTVKKDASFYVFCDNNNIGYLNEQQYTVLRQAEDRKNND